MSNSEIDALISLLDDESETVQVAVLQRLREMGPIGVSALERATQSPELREETRIRAHAALSLLKIEPKSGHLLNVLASPECELLEAVTLLAEVESPQEDCRGFINREIKRLSAKLKQELEGANSGREIAEALGKVLHGEEGFHGNADEYYDPRNSYLHEVLRRKVGIPISLSALYMLVGRSCGLDLHGVGMPSHFLVHFQIDDEVFLIDAFGGGTLLTPEHCKKMLAGFRHSFRDDYLRPVSDRHMLRRMMANLIHIYQHHEDESRLHRFYGYVNSIQGRNA